jgi:membrane protease YdiL (CAAX protease family)
MVYFVLSLLFLALAVLLPILAVTIKPKSGKFDFKWFRWTRGEFFWFWFLPLGILVSIVIVRLLVSQLRLPSATPDIRFMTGSYLCYYMPLYVWLIIRTCVLTPVVEEFFWRGYVQSTLLKISHPVFAILCQAVIFGLVHFQPILGFLQLSLIGLVFGIWCYRRKTLLPVIIIHIAINSFVFISGWCDRREVNQVKITKNYVTEFIELSKPDAYKPDNDAGQQYRKALRLVKKIPKKLKEVRKHYPHRWSPEEFKMTESWIASNKQSLNLIEKGTQKPYYWVKYRRRNNLLYDRMPVLIPSHLKNTEHVIFALCMRAKLRASKGQFDQSFRDIETCSKFGYHLVANKSRTLKLYGSACYSFMVQTMRMILAYENIDSKSLENLQNHFKKLTEQNVFEFDFTGERFLLLDAIQIMFTDDGQGGGRIPGCHFNKYLRDGEFEYVNSILSLVDKSDIKKWKRLRRRETTEQVEKYCELLKRMSSYSPLQYERNFQNLKTNYEQLQKENPLIKTFAFNPKLLFLPWRARVDIDSLITILAILRNKADTGKHPDDLSELVIDGYIETIPDDAYGDGPIVYKRIENGFLLYSFGVDFNDDGGKPYKDAEGEMDGDDIFWPVEGTDEYTELLQIVTQKE